MVSHVTSSRAGFGLLETLISFAIIAASLVTLATTNQFAFKVIKNSFEKTQANFLAEEGLEVARVLRDTSWSVHFEPLQPGIIYYPIFNATTSTWALATGAALRIDDVFTRTLTVEEVYRRDADSQIVASTSPDAKTLDPDTKQVTLSVQWDAGEVGERRVDVGTYIANLFQN